MMAPTVVALLILEEAFCHIGILVKELAWSFVVTTAALMVAPTDIIGEGIFSRSVDVSHEARSLATVGACALAAWTIFLKGESESCIHNEIILCHFGFSDSSEFRFDGHCSSLL